MEKEVWKIYYNGPRVTWEVSDQGNVKKNNKLYECRLNSGYKVFGRNYAVHRAVAKLFISNPNNYNEVDHINGNRLDNRACNLQWCTHKENNNNPITRKRRSKTMKEKYKNGYINPLHGKSQSKETRRKRSESMKGKNKNTHRVYHNDGTYHMNKNIINNK